MSYQDEIAGIMEPSLKAIFDRLNKKFFNDELPLPDTLAYDYRHRKAGGSILTSKNGGQCYYIVVRGKQKDNANFEEETMLHEMVHWLLARRFFLSELPALNYRLRDFIKDSSASFILEGARISAEYGCSFAEFQRWSNEDNPDQDTTITSKKYSELQDAKSLLGSLS